MACVRFKRALTEDVAAPSPMIIVKRRRLSNDVQEDQCSPTRKKYASPAMTATEKSNTHEQDQFKAIFKFVGTVESKDEDVDPLISRAVMNECQASGSHLRWKPFENQTYRSNGAKKRAKDDHRRRRRRDHHQQQQAISSEARYRLVSTLRGVDPDPSPSKNLDAMGSSTFEEAVKGLYTLYDIEELPASSSDKSKGPMEQITCNGVAMICEQNPPTKYVYDLYFMHDCNVDELESTQDPVCIEPYFDSESQDLYGDGNSDAVTADGDDDSDSNDESNWRNDYPEEDDDFEKGYDYYRDYGDVDIDGGLIDELGNYASDSDDDEDPSAFVTHAIAGRNDAIAETGLHRHLESMALQDSSDGEEVMSASFEEVMRLHGRTYAEYKARLKAYVNCVAAADVPSEAKSNDALK